MKGKKIKDKKVIWLITQIVGHLNELDRFIKQKLEVEYYIRYVDDLVVLHPSVDYLFEVKNQMQKFLTENLNLSLYPKKTFVIPLDKGLDLLGYRVFYFYKLLREGNVQRFKKRLRRLKYQYALIPIN